jgi:hypothetical protein
MTLLWFFIALVPVFLFLIFRKDRAFLRKTPKDTVSDETKKYLNLPTTDAEFPHILSKGRPEGKLSRRILDEMNSK